MNSLINTYSVFLFTCVISISSGLVPLPVLAEADKAEKKAAESTEEVDLSKVRDWTSIQGRTIKGVLVSRSGRNLNGRPYFAVACLALRTPCSPARMRAGG